MNKFLAGLLLGLIVTVLVIHLIDEEHDALVQQLAAEYAENLAALEEEQAGQYCYEPYGTAVQPERMSTKAIVEVVWFHEGTRGGDAFAQWVVGDSGTADCTLYIHMPQNILGDPDMDGIGHEFLHCVAGNFHPEDE